MVKFPSGISFAFVIFFLGLEIFSEYVLHANLVSYPISHQCLISVRPKKEYRNGIMI